MEHDELSRTIEAILLVAVEPLPPQLLAELTEEKVERVEEVLHELACAYDRDRRGFVLAPTGTIGLLMDCDTTGVEPDFALVKFKKLAGGGYFKIVNQSVTAALETLAIVAYRQPVSRGQIAALRGVNVDGVTRLLEQRGYIEVVGHAEGPGQAALYATTDLFLERLGLDSLAQLPPVEDFLPGPEVAGDFERDLQSALGLGVEASDDA